MNQHPVTARTLAAALALAALWPVGCRAAGAAGQTAALPAASAAKADGRPSSVPAALPMVFQGKWTPIGRAFTPHGPLTLGARTLRWSVCGKAARRIKLDTGTVDSWLPTRPSTQTGRRMRATCRRR
jgi:hypothetical protein